MRGRLGVFYLLLCAGLAQARTESDIKKILIDLQRAPAIAVHAQAFLNANQTRLLQAVTVCEDESYGNGKNPFLGVTYNTARTNFIRWRSEEEWRASDSEHDQKWQDRYYSNLKRELDAVTSKPHTDTWNLRAQGMELLLSVDMGLSHICMSSKLTSNEELLVMSHELEHYSYFYSQWDMLDVFRAVLPKMKDGASYDTWEKAMIDQWLMTPGDELSAYLTESLVQKQLRIFDEDAGRFNFLSVWGKDAKILDGIENQAQISASDRLQLYEHLQKDKNLSKTYQQGITRDAIRSQMNYGLKGYGLISQYQGALDRLDAWLVSKESDQAGALYLSELRKYRKQLQEELGTFRWLLGRYSDFIRKP